MFKEAKVFVWNLITFGSVFDKLRMSEDKNTTLLPDQKKPRRKNDELLKGAFEDNFPDFLRFIYPDADEILDFEKGIAFLNNELFAIIPSRKRKGGERRADLLAKLYLKDGTETWILLNVEIEGGSDHNFAHRVFQYNYRIRDRHNVSVASIAVFTGKKSQIRPTAYLDELLETVLSFKYTAYHIFDHKEDALLKSRNPFSLIALACQPIDPDHPAILPLYYS